MLKGSRYVRRPGARRNGPEDDSTRELSRPPAQRVSRRHAFDPDRVALLKRGENLDAQSGSVADHLRPVRAPLPDRYSAPDERPLAA